MNHRELLSGIAIGVTAVVIVNRVIRRRSKAKPTKGKVVVTVTVDGAPVGDTSFVQMTEEVERLTRVAQLREQHHRKYKEGKLNHAAYMKAWEEAGKIT